MTAVLITLCTVFVAARAEMGLPDDNSGGAPRPAGIATPAPAASSYDGSSKAGENQIGDMLEFLNNDKLHGSLAGVSPDTRGLKWKHPDAEGQITFNLSRLSSATLAKRPGAKTAPCNAVVRLTNGDVLPGNVVSMDAEKLVMDSWYAGKLNINRAMIKKVSPNAAVSTIVYEGPVDLESWTQGRGRRGMGGAWKYKDGALSAIQPSPIGRMIDKMPDMADIRFDASWRAMPSFCFFFFGDNAEQVQGNGYQFQMSGASIYLYRVTREGGSRNIGSLNLQQFEQGALRRGTFNFLVSKKDKSVVFLLDGKMIQQWTDTGDTSALGKGILFYPQSQGDLRISNIVITEWDGKIPQSVGAEPEQKEDLVRLVNGDKISGRVKSLAAGKLKFETSYTTLDIPLEQVLVVDMSTENAARARRNKDDVRMRFFDRGEITFGLTKIENGEIKGHSENFGTIAMPLGAFRLIEFNIYEERSNEDSDSQP